MLNIHLLTMLKNTEKKKGKSYSLGNTGSINTKKR